MGVPRFLIRLVREAPSTRRLLRSFPLGTRPGDREIASADGTVLRARRSGDGNPLVLVHGTLDGIGSFSFVELELAERFAVWTYDRRGRGGSGDGPEHSLAREVDDLAAVIAEAGGSPHVVAHSYGAVVALTAAHDGVGMRSLTLYEPPLHGDAIPAETVARIRDALDDGRADDAIRTMASDLAGVSDEELAVAMRVPPVRNRLRDGVRTAPRELDALRSREQDAAPLADLPVLALMGERRGSAAYPSPGEAAALAVDVTIAELPGQGHLGHVFAPAAFAATVLGFVDRY